VKVCERGREVGGTSSKSHVSLVWWYVV